MIGLCWSDDLRTWEVDDPILEINPERKWESGGLYKSWIVEADGTYYMFYNARDQKDKKAGPWKERTGMVTSNDLVSWERYAGNPVLDVGSPGAFDDRFASDPCVLQMGDTWVMFYFGNCTDGHARDGVAFSDDLFHWQKSNEVLLDIGPLDSIDACHAHKPGMICRDGVLYHFYCAVGPSEKRTVGAHTMTTVRGISLATA